MIDSQKPILIISDIQVPFEHEKALSFCTYLKRHFQVPDENVLCVGDELDNLHGGAWPKNPDGSLSPVGEIAISRMKIQEWGAVFPQMKLAISNHGMRWVRKAIAAEIPTQILRAYEQIFDMPKDWRWQDEWRFLNLKHPFRMIHGTDYSGKDGARNAAMDAKLSTVVGHIHAHAGITHIHNKGMPNRIYGFNVGCMIDKSSYAFEYDKKNRVEPCLGAGIIYDSGRVPLWVPLE